MVVDACVRVCVRACICVDVAFASQMNNDDVKVQ